MSLFKSIYKKFASSKFFKVFTNFYILISFIFIIWMIFLDTNSYLIHNRLNSEIEQLIIKKENLKKEIEKDIKFINDMKDLDKYEAFARENFYMKKDGEEIYIIEYKDSIEN